MNWEWLSRNATQIWTWTLEHFWLAAVPTVLGLLLALPLGAAAHRYRWSYGVLITIAGLLYTIPSIALFVVLPAILGTRILDPLNVVVALTLYTLALMVRGVAAVSNVSLVSVAALLGIPQLGQLFTLGFQLNFYTPIIAGIVFCLVLAAIFDAIILISVRLATPWTRAVKAR